MLNGKSFCKLSFVNRHEVFLLPSILHSRLEAIKHFQRISGKCKAILAAQTGCNEVGGAKGCFGGRVGPSQSDHTCQPASAGDLQAPEHLAELSWWTCQQSC